jgi:hypothetical protein
LTGLKGGKPDSTVVVHVSGDASIRIKIDPIAAPREWPIKTKPKHLKGSISRIF